MPDTESKTSVEITIPVPWGHIAGKAWGNSAHQPVLALHGKQDNCGVFDRLIGLLKGDYYIIAIDLPGHGFSSHFPSGMFIHMLNYVHSIVIVVRHLQWKRFNLLTHSLGGQIGSLFTAIFPQYIDKFIVIDHIAPSYVPDEDVVDHLSMKFKEFIKMNERLEKGKSPVYSYQVALEKLTNRDSVLTNEAAEIVLKRSLQKVDNGYTFCMDQRLKLHPFPSLTNTIWNNVLRSLKCPMLYIFSSERFHVYEQMFHESFECIKKKPNVTIKFATGNHDLHQNHPERVAPLVDEFFARENCQSWNSDSEERILMLHGILHNCGSFKRLISLFKNDYNIVAIDLPGHGRSSHFPAGAPLEFTQYILAVKRVINYLKWQKFSLVGHSFGGQIATYFTANFPQGIQSLVIIDTMEPRPVLLHDTLMHLQTTFQRQLDLENKLSGSSPPVYSYQQIYEKVKKNGDWKLSDKAAEDLIDRSVIQVNGGYSFCFDQRLKYPSRPLLVFEQQEQIIKSIMCPVLFILAEGNMARYGTYLKQMYELNSKKRNTTIVVVKGDHAVHQNYPERISHLIDEFVITRKLNDQVEGVIHRGSELYNQ